MNKQAEYIKKLLDKYDDVYYRTNDKEVFDEEYDALKEQYLKLTGLEDYNFISGSNSKEFKTFKHPIQIKSLGKEDDLESLKAKIKSLMPIVIQPKIDGLTLVMYSDHKVTRGQDGLEGEIVDNTANKVSNLKDLKTTFPVRMEVYMSKENLEDINIKREEQGLKKFENTRNAASGTLRNLDISKVEGLDYLAYNIVGSKLTETEQLAKLQAMGFIIVPYVEFREHQLEEAIDYILHFDKNSLPYDIDGLVIKSNKPDSLSIFGETEHHPKNALAYKFPPEGKWTILKEVIWQVGRSGKVTPVGIFEPIRLAGSTVEKATLHNLAYINAFGFRINQTVKVIKAHDIIPAIVDTIISPLRHTFPIVPPTNCPICGSALHNDNDQLFCYNEDCIARLAAKISHMASKEALNIEGLSEETAQKLVDFGIKTPTDIFSLTIDDIKKLEGFADSSAKKLCQAINNSKIVPFDKFLVSCGIPLVGKKSARDIANAMGSYEDLIEDLNNGHVKLDNIAGIGVSTVLNLILNIKTIEEFRKYINPISMEKKTVVNQMTFVITGTFEIPRSEIEKIITDAGHKTSSSVSKKTNYVLIGSDPGSKADKARDLGVSILTSIDELKEVIY